MECPFSLLFTALLLKTRAFKRLTTSSAQHILCLTATSVFPSSAMRLPRYTTEGFQWSSLSLTFTFGKLFLSTVPGRWKHINSHFAGDKRRPNGEAVSTIKFSISCIPSAVNVSKIWSSVYSSDERWRCTSLMPSNAMQKERLMNASATVKKFGDAGQPCRTPRFRSNSGSV